MILFFFFFQAEDGIRDADVTGVQTCALPILELASDKEETNRLLANLGLPVPRQRLVQREDDAVAAAERVGYPVVVKPYNANHGRGISIHLTTEEQVRNGFALAREHSRSVIVESFIIGED